MITFRINSLLSNSERCNVYWVLNIDCFHGDICDIWLINRKENIFTWQQPKATPYSNVNWTSRLGEHVAEHVSLEYFLFFRSLCFVNTQSEWTSIIELLESMNNYFQEKVTNVMYTKKWVFCFDLLDMVRNRTNFGTVNSDRISMNCR